jgi:hypothetical protein
MFPAQNRRLEDTVNAKRIIVSAVFMVFAMVGVAGADYFSLVGPSGQIVYIDDPAGKNKGTMADLYTVKFGSSATNYNLYDAFCVDYADINWNTGYYTFSSIPVPDVAAYKEAAWIMTNYKALAASFSLTADQRDAAAQVAVWDIVFQGLSGGNQDPTNYVQNTQSGSKFALHDGSFNKDQLAFANTLVGAALNNSSFDAYSFRLLVSPSTTGYYGQQMQDFMVQVPEPFTLLFLGGCLLGAGVASRRFRI